ncbi:MAG: phenylalanine--tRNA ligase subunit beta [Brevinema sp.]
MKITVSYEWLCDLVQDLNNKTPEEIALAFTSIGAETEDLSILSYGSACLLGEITAIETLKKLSKVQIKTTQGEFTTVSNSAALRLGEYIVFAPLNTKIFGNHIVSAKNIEGITTEGLILALENLGIESKSHDIAFLGTCRKTAEEFFTTFCRLDAIYTLDIPGNRPDWLSVRELARALAITFDLPLKEYSYQEYNDIPCDLSVHLQSDRCVRYSLSKISQITPISTPAYIQKRLYLLGMRPINYLVDMSNSALLELGQPNHIFDASKIKGSIIIRQAKDGEQFTLLDHTTVTLCKEDLLICDEEKILALAGIMGGLDSGVSEQTTEIYIESASFNGVWIRRSAKRLGIKTESSLRFEKNITLTLVPKAQLYLCHVFNQQLPNLKINPYSDQYPQALQAIAIAINPREINQYLGTEISEEYIKMIITKIGCSCDDSQIPWLITACENRGDIRIKEDLMEEVARFYGYDNIPCTNYRPSSIQLNPEKSFDEKIRPILRGMGLSEAVTNVFRSPEQKQFYRLTQENSVPILNPLNTEWTELRTHLFDGLLEVLHLNISKAFEKNIAFSEIASVFSHKGEEEFCEEKLLTFMVSNENQSYQNALNYLYNILNYAKIPTIQSRQTDKYSFLHPLNAFELYIDNQYLGFFGEIHPLLLEKLDLSDKKDYPAPIVCELSFSILSSYAEQNIKVQKIAELPPLFRDITLSVDDKKLGINLLEELKQKNPLIKEIEFLSVFQNEQLKAQGKKNISLRIRFESEQVINAQEIDLFIKDLLQL